MLKKVNSPELKEQSLASIVAYINCFDGSLIHRFVKMVPLERRYVNDVCHCGFVVWSQEEVAEVIACLGMMEKIWAKVAATLAAADAYAQNQVQDQDQE